MSFNKNLLFAFCFLFLYTSCSNEEEPIIPPIENNQSTALNKLMPLGASRVEGARPFFHSYRYDLWKLMVDGGWDFDFIGTKIDLANYPEYEGLNFDLDHEGRGGWTSGQILAGIEDWLDQAGAPDIVLFSSPGGNDALQGLPYADAIANVNGIIDAIQRANPEVTIIIEQPAPARSDAMTAELTVYFNQMQEDVVNIATAQSTTTSRIITVDIATGFTDSFFADEVHYNQAGATFVADKYYTSLQDVLKQ